MVSASPPVLAADLNDGLKRLKMAAMRRLAPELLITAKTQRWSPEEFLRTLVEAEIASRDASNTATRRRKRARPVESKAMSSILLPPRSMPTRSAGSEFIDFSSLASSDSQRMGTCIRLASPGDACFLNPCGRRDFRLHFWSRKIA